MVERPRMLTLVSVWVALLLSAGIFSMRCCIASLESLEDTLVPALIAFYTDSANQSKRLLLKTLSNHWSDEIVQLETLLHRVIDTAAMSKVRGICLMQSE